MHGTRCHSTHELVSSCIYSEHANSSVSETGYWIFLELFSGELAQYLCVNSKS